MVSAMAEGPPPPSPVVVRPQRLTGPIADVTRGASAVEGLLSGGARNLSGAFFSPLSARGLSCAWGGFGPDAVARIGKRIRRWRPQACCPHTEDGRHVMIEVEGALVAWVRGRGHVLGERMDVGATVVTVRELRLQR